MCEPRGTYSIYATRPRWINVNKADLLKKSPQTTPKREQTKKDTDNIYTGGLRQCIIGFLRNIPLKWF